MVSKCLQNTNQKIPHKILGKVMKFQPLTLSRFEFCTKNHLGGGGGTKCPHPGLDRVKLKNLVQKRPK